MRLKIVFCILCIFLFVSCVPKVITPYKQTNLKIERTAPYEIRKTIESVPRPKKIVPIYVKEEDDNYTVVESMKESTHIMLAPEEYAKIGTLVKLAATYKEIILINESVINTYINEINALKELNALEKEKVRSYRELWINSE